MFDYLSSYKETAIARRIASPFSPRCSIRVMRFAELAFKDIPSTNANFAALLLPTVLETNLPVEDERCMMELFLMCPIYHNLVSKCKWINCFLIDRTLPGGRSQWMLQTEYRQLTQ